MLVSASMRAGNRMLVRAVVGSRATGVGLLGRTGFKSHQRMLSSFRYLDLEDDIDSWPKTAANTILNICPQVLNTVS